MVKTKKKFINELFKALRKKLAQVLSDKDYEFKHLERAKRVMKEW